MQARWRRFAVFSALGTAALLFGSYCVWRVPDSVVGLVGGKTGVERTGGLRVRYQHADSAARGSEGERSLDYPGLTTADEPLVRAALEQGGLRFREVMNETAYAIQAHQAAERFDSVTPDIDVWSTSLGRRVDYYLSAPTQEALKQAVTELRDRHFLSPEEGSEVGYESKGAILPTKEWPEGTPANWRTYVLRTQHELDASMIHNAYVAREPDWDSPLVFIDLTEEGERRFCEITGRLTGHKLAATIGDRVYTAPVINQPICGGQLTISLQGTEDEAETAAVLAALLARGEVLPGGRVTRVDRVEPSSATAERWGRGLIALVGGALVGLLCWLVLRWTQPRLAAPGARWPGGFPWKRLAMTAAAPVVLLLGSEVPLPTADVATVLARLGAPSEPELHATSLGLRPLLAAFVFVEIVALAVPRWRWRRHDPRGRAGLGITVAGVAVALALVQGWFIASNLTVLFEHSDLPQAPLFHVSIAVSLACGTVLLAVVAHAISEHGLGNGYGVLATSEAGIELGRLGLAGKLSTSHVPAGLALVAIVVITAVVLRWRVDGDRGDRGDRVRGLALRVPTSGLEPVIRVAGLVLVHNLLVTIGLGLSAEVTNGVDLWLASPAVAVGATLALTALWSWLQARPALFTGAAALTRVTPFGARTWARATLLSAMACAMIAVLYGASPDAAELASAATAMIAAAVVMDGLTDARALRADLVPAAALHQVQRVGIAELLLDRAGIPYHLRNAHLRTLLAFFGPWAPVVVLVPAEHGARARELLAPLSESALAAPAAPHPPEALVSIDRDDEAR